MKLRTLNAWERAALWWRKPWMLTHSPNPILDCIMATDARAGLVDDELRAQRCDLFGAITRTIDRCADV